MKENDYFRAADQEYFEAFGITPSKEDPFDDLRAVFEIARLHGITPDALRTGFLEEKRGKVHFVHPAALANMMCVERFLAGILDGQDADMEGQQCTGLTHTPVVDITSISDITFEGAAILGLKKCFAKLRSISASALNKQGFILEFEIKEEK